jgi:hypothetical protein
MSYTRSSPNPVEIIDPSTGLPLGAGDFGGGGGSGGAVTVADGADSTQGSLTDTAATTGTGGTLSLAALLRGILNTLLTPVTFLAPTPLLTASDMSRYKVAITNNTGVAIVALTSGQTVRIHRMRLYAKTTAVDVSIYDGDPGSGGTELENIPLAAGGGIILDFDSRPYWESTSGATLYLKASGSCDLRGQVAYKKSA